MLDYTLAMQMVYGTRKTTSHLPPPPKRAPSPLELPKRATCPGCGAPAPTGRLCSYCRTPR